MGQTVERSEERLRRAVAAFSDVAASMLGRTADIDDLLHAVAREISALVGVERCSIHLRDEATGRFRGCVAQCGDMSLDRDIKRSLAGGPADGMTAELVETMRPVVLKKADRDPRMVKSTARFWKIRSIMAVPMVLAGEVVGVIFLDDVDRLHEFTEGDGDVAMVFAGLAAVAVVQAQDHVDLCTQVDVARRQLKALRRAAAVDERLSDLVLHGRPLQDLLDTLAKLLGKPCAVFTADGRRVATGVPPGVDDGIAPRLLEPELASRPAVRDALAEHDGSPAFVVGPLPAAGVLHRHVVAPVRVGDDLWGRLVVMEHKTRFTGGDMVTLRRAATLVALQVTTERRVLEAGSNASGSLVAELLGRRTDPVALQRRAEHVGVRLDAPRAVLVLGARSGGDRELPQLNTVTQALAGVAPGVEFHGATVGDAVVLLAELPPQADERAFVAGQRALLEELLAELPGGHRLVGAVSAIHAEPEGYRAGFEEARQVLDCIRRFAPPAGPSVLTADELGAGRLFLATSDADLVTTFADETFGGMVSDTSKADLLTTLCSFFENMASIRRTAACLGLHENTIRYRLSRIEELTGLAVTHDPDAQLRARLSLLVLLLQGRLPVAAEQCAEPEERASFEVVRGAV